MATRKRKGKGKRMVVTKETYGETAEESLLSEGLIEPVGPIEPVDEDPRFEPPADEPSASDRASRPDGYVEPGGTKHNNRCLANAGDDEPIFVLRAHDALAVPTVLYWIDLAASVGVPADKLERARVDVKNMEAWARVHGCKRPD